MATLTYVYADQTAVLGPLAATRVPGAHDLCGDHAERTSVPRGWEVIRLPLEEVSSTDPGTDEDDDLLALADAVRAIGLRHDDVEPAPVAAPRPDPAVAEPRQVGHLRLLPSLD